MDRLIALLGLHWRIELRGLLRRRERAAGLVLAAPVLLLFSGMAALFVFVGVRALDGSRPELVLPLLSALATAVGLLGALSPLLPAGTLAEAHDLSRLVHFPVPLPTLAVSSLVANLAQPMVLARLPILAALALGLAGGAASLPLCFAGLALAFALILAGGQAVGLVLHAFSRNRRLHDVALFLGLGLGFLLSVAPILLLASDGRPIGWLGRWLVSTDAFALSPFAWGVRAAVHAGRGDAGAFAVTAAGAATALVAAVACSSYLIGRIYRGELDLGGGLREAAAPARMALGGPLGALVEKDLRAAWRDPALRAMLLMGLAWPLLFLFLLSRGPGSQRSGSAVLVLASIVGFSTYGANAFFLERRGILLLMSFSLPRWKLLVGKNLGAMLFQSPRLVVLLLAGLVLAPAAYIPAAAAIAIATLLVASGLDNFMSILFPVVAPAAAGSAYGGGGVAGGRGLGAAIVGAFLLAAVLLLSAPFTLLAWLPLLLNGPWLWWLTLPLCVAGAAAVYAMLVAGAARLLARREPELVERILGEE